MVKSLPHNFRYQVVQGVFGLSRFLMVLGVMCLTGAGFGQGLEPIPNAAAQADAKRLVDEVYADLLDVRSDEDRAAAARVLIMRADQTKNVPAAKFVMYDTARSLAVEAGDTDAAMDAINGLIRSFKDDSGGFLDVASASIQALSRKARKDTQYAAVAEAGLAIAERMIAAEKQEEALDLLTRLRSSALRSRRPELVNTYKEIVEKLKAVRVEAERIAGDLKAIEQDPDDPDLNLSVGKYLALYRGDWKTGLKMLAKSSDEVFAAAAKADLAGAGDTKTQIAMGDRWWVLASKHTKLESQGLTERAKYWYRKALPSASGIERSLLTKRLESQGQVRWGDLVLEPGIRTWIEVDSDTASVKPGPIAKEATWEFKKKPANAKSILTLHFEGYLFFLSSKELGIKTLCNSCSIAVNLNGKLALSGYASSETTVKFIKGYNKIRGSIMVQVMQIENPSLLPTAKIVLTELDGKEIVIPAEHWFHDATR